MADTPAAIQVQLTVTSTERDHALAYVGADGRVDNAANRFRGYIRNNAAQAIVFIEKIDPTGAVVGIWQLVHPLQGYKADSFSMYPSGRDLIVDVYLHGPTDQATGQRNTDTCQTVLQGVWASPDAPDGAAGAFVGGGVSGGGDVDYERIQTMIDTATAALLHDIVAAFGGDIRRGIHDKAKQAAQEAISEAHVMTEAMFAGGSGSPVVYQQLVNTSYTGALGAIHDSGHAQGQTTQQGQGEPSK